MDCEIPSSLDTPQVLLNGFAGSTVFKSTILGLPNFSWLSKFLQSLVRFLEPVD